MGTNKSKARELAIGWWELEIASDARERGYANCDSIWRHKISVGEGYLCNPSRMGDRTPDLVCEKCFDEYPYDPWDGGYSGLKAGPYKTIEQALDALKPKKKKWWQFWK